MVKKISLSVILLAILILCFVPVTQEKTLSIKMPFLTLYCFLSNPENWEHWRPDLRKNLETDPAKIRANKTASGFTLVCDKNDLNVKQTGGYFEITDNDGGGSTEYGYLLAPGKRPDSTLVTIYKPTNGLGLVLDKFKPDAFSATHINQLKNFIETDSLYFGYKISRVHVPGGLLIVTQANVAKNERFSEMQKLVAKLNDFIKSRNVKKVQPVIAQFLPAAKDSVAVKAGYFIDQEVKSGDGVQFNRMPERGWAYTIDYSGKFDKRQPVYDALNHFFSERNHQLVIKPFEMYPDGHLPTSDTDKISPRVYFPAFP